MTVDEAIAKMQAGAGIIQRKPVSLSWGDYPTCTRLFAEIFRKVDHTVGKFIMLPEYEPIIRWMVDTQGKGLFLSGSCGRGKSVIITGVIPVLLAMKGYSTVRAYHAEQMREKQNEIKSPAGDLPTVLDVLKFVCYPIIDDVGTEPMINDYGEKFEGFSQVMNAAEMKLKPVFASTNLSSAQLTDRYGLRTVDRIGRLCLPVKFEGESLR